VAKPVDLLSSLVQRKITTGGGALPGGAVAANALNAEVSRQSREADRTVEAVNDGVRNSVTGKSDTAGPIPTSKVAAANPAPTLFTLELGAFHTAADAQAFARNVGARGYPVEIVEEASNDGGTVSRVRSGHFSDRTLAADMQKKLEDTAGLGATIVQASSAHPG
jgi:cell division septation protein DedD